MRIEIHPGEGGDDAVQFAQELGRAIAKHASGSLDLSGRVVAVDAPHSL